MDNQVVIVDDDVDILDIIAETLSEAGFSAISFSDSAQAWHYLQTHRPALVLTDLYVPPMGGQTLIQQIRQTYGDDLPVVVVSALHQQDMSRFEGVQGILNKPFELDALIAEVKRLT